METNDSSGTPERIGFGKRLGAYLLDYVISIAGGAVIGIFAGATLAALILGSDMGAEMTEGMEGVENADALAGGIAGILGGMAGTIAGMLIIMLGIMVLEAFTGQTIGKMILGIKNGNEDGTTAGTGALLTRAGIKYIGTLMTVLAGITGMAILGTIGSIGGFVVFIGCFLVLGAKKQAIHDMIAKTAVFNKSDLK